ncbi:amidohydrolase family protein [Candidatus Bathyarchaeota archaeon]|nr:amidohydrolase family protein [Candidatus Bathyarchaeota archaeon]
MKDSKQLYADLREKIKGIRIFDTHEHLIQEKERTSKRIDLFETILAHYASSDLVSSGMPQEDLDTVRNPRLPIEKRWEIFKPYWERIQNTGYARVLNIAFRDLYSINELNGESYLKLVSRMEKANKPGVYKWILKEKSGVDISILDSLSAPLEEVDREFFAPVKRFDDFVMAKERTDIEALAKRCGRSIHSFSDMVNTLELEFEKASKMIVGVKIGLAYLRKLRFEKVSEKEAEEVFVDIFNREFFRREVSNAKVKRTPDGLSLGETKPFQDFMVHKIIQLAARKRLPIQIHTGIQEGNENIITNSKPTNLINIFREYKEAKFDIFHGSYPYIGELAVLAKNFPNVYIDMCWLHIISPHGARQALAEWLDTVPWNKIFGFGGDYIFAEGVYGHSVIAKENISRVLAEKVEEGSLTEKQAATLAQKLLKDNAHNLFFPETPKHAT